MNKNTARKLAEIVTNEQLEEMFDEAKRRITDWTKQSNVNKGITKGTSWNILAQNFNKRINYSVLTKTNMIREFGEYLSTEIKPKQRVKKTLKLVHQEPKFN
jgi:hypothetical protein